MFNLMSNFSGSHHGGRPFIIRCFFAYSYKINFKDTKKTKKLNVFQRIFVILRAIFRNNNK